MREGSQADWICELRRRMSRTAASPQVVHKSSEDDDSRERIISIEHVDDESPGIFRTPKSGTQLRTLTDRKGEPVDDDSPGLFRTPKSGTQLRTLPDRNGTGAGLTKDGISIEDAMRALEKAEAALAEVAEIKAALLAMSP